MPGCLYDDLSTEAVTNRPLTGSKLLTVWTASHPRDNFHRLSQFVPVPRGHDEDIRLPQRRYVAWKMKLLENFRHALAVSLPYWYDAEAVEFMLG
jgi:hypothetical protein